MRQKLTNLKFAAIWYIRKRRKTRDLRETKRKKEGNERKCKEKLIF